MKKILVSILLILLTLTQACAQQESTTKVNDSEVVKNFLSKTQSTLKETRDIGSLYELTIEQGKRKGVVYLTKDGRYLIFGNLFDKDNKNITQERNEEINKIDFSKLPLNEAVAIKKGNGSKKLVMITDVDCPFCIKSYQWLKEKTDYTLYVFLYPLPMHPNAYEKSIKILCSENQETALSLAKEDKEIPAKKCDDGENKLKRHMSMAEELGVTGTPFFIIDTGRGISGFNQPMLEEYLKK